MKFDCGETWEEKKARLMSWHRRFAWLPVDVDDHDCRWLEFVERRGVYRQGEFEPFEWKYRAIR